MVIAHTIHVKDVIRRRFIVGYSHSADLLTVNIARWERVR